LDRHLHVLAETLQKRKVGFRDKASSSRMLNKSEWFTHRVNSSQNFCEKNHKQNVKKAVCNNIHIP